MKMRDLLLERPLDGRRSYPYEYLGSRIQTREFEDDTGGRLPHPIEQKKYCFDADNGLQYIVHCNLANHELETSFTVIGGKIHLNGRGDALKVLGTVSKIVSDYCRADPPRAIGFTADQREPSRVKLYDFMCEHADRFFPGYTLETREPFGRTIKYRLTRPLTKLDAERDAQDAAEKVKIKAKPPAPIPQRDEPDTRTPQQKQHDMERLDRMLADEDPEILRLLGLLESEEKTTRGMLLYHGTSERKASSIVNGGFRLSRGGNTFGKSISFSNMPVGTRFYDKGAILVYRFKPSAKVIDLRTFQRDGRGDAQAVIGGGDGYYDDREIAVFDPAAIEFLGYYDKERDVVSATPPVYTKGFHHSWG